MSDNICHFVSYHKDCYSIHIINFVLETKLQIYKSLKSESIYKVHYVNSGRGMLHTMGKVQPLAAGDVFVTFPASPYCIESIEDFSYMYISFLGSRSNMIMERTGVSVRSFLFSGCNELHDIWSKGIHSNSELLDLISESVLLYTFSYIGNKTLATDSKTKSAGHAALIIKKYIDDNLSNTDLSLESISKEFSYNKKYISTVFKKYFGIGIAEYLNTVRIQHACTLIEQGFTSVSDIANCCGFADPQYFSKVFKQKFGTAPSVRVRRMK